MKGSRALIKVYTSLKVAAENANACYGPGIEPTITMVRLHWLACDQSGGFHLRQIRQCLRTRLMLTSSLLGRPVQLLKMLVWLLLCAL